MTVRVLPQSQKDGLPVTEPGNPQAEQGRGSSGAEVCPVELDDLGPQTSAWGGRGSCWSSGEKAGLEGEAGSCRQTVEAG